MSDDAFYMMVAEEVGGDGGVLGGALNDGGASPAVNRVITVEECLKQNYPLHYACLKGAPLNVVKYLVEEADGDKGKELLGKADNFGSYPLHLACYGRASLDVVKYLVEEADGDKGKELLGKADKYGKYPLHLACSKGASLDVVKYLVEAADDIDKGKELLGRANNNGSYPLHWACGEGASLNVVKYLVEEAYGDKGKELLGRANNNGRYPLHCACYGGALDVVKYLVEEADGDKGKELLGKADNFGSYPLHSACYGRASLDVVKYLVEEADGDKGKELLGKGINYDRYMGALPLHSAIMWGTSADVIRVLLEADSSAAEKTVRVSGGAADEDMLPLHLAIDTQRSPDVVKAILDAYPQAAKKKMKDGRLPIEMCAENKILDDLVLAFLEADMPLRRDGTPAEHGGSWTACVKNETDVAGVAVSRILSPVSEGGVGFGVHIHALAAVCDAEGRTTLGLASSRTRAVINKYRLFSRRYELQNGAPEHRTPTAVVLRAQDLDEQADYGVIFDEADKDNNGKLDRQEISSLVVSKIGLDPELFLKGSDESISKEDFVGICNRQLGDGPRNVVIKLMQKKHQWERECDIRKQYNLDPKYVVSALPNIPSETEIAEAVKKGDGGLEIIVTKFLDGVKPGKYAIVMDAADRNLLQIFYQEQPKIDAVRVMLRQVLEAVQHLHGKNLMHGDLKMLNIVRFRIDNRLRLIDFDASSKIVPICGQGESFAGAKFSSAILPPEMIERIDTEEQIEKFNKYWEGENDEVLNEKVAPKLYEEQGIVRARYVVKSFRTKGDAPLYEGLPYTLVKASENIDAWALGVLAFTLLTGKTLIPSTRDDDCASGAAMHLLYSWGTQPKVLIELFKKIQDDAARDLVGQLLQREPEKRPTVASLLEKHPFFHPERDNKEMKDRLERFEKNQESQVKQLEKMNANIVMIKKLSIESKFELRHTCHVLLKGIFEATEVSTPSSFIVVKTKLELTTEPSDIEVGMKWVERIISVFSNVADGQVDAAFETIKEGIKDLIVGKEMYLYLIDELTGEPVQAKDWPITITEPSEIVPKLLPLMKVGMRAMSIYNGAAGLAKMFGYPAPIVPKAWAEGAQESVELLKQDSSVEQFAVVHAEVQGGTEESKSVRGASLREFMDFMSKNDPGLKDGKSGDFAGLQRIGDPEDGTALWTTLTDSVAIEDALKKRAKQRKEEQLKQNEHIQKMAKVEVEKSAATKENDPAVVAGNTCCKVETAAAAKEAASAVAASNVCCTIM